MSKCPIFTPGSAEIGKLILRLCVGVMMIPHGISKITGGIDGIKGMIAGMGLPEFAAYGVYIGEVLAPVLIIIGLKTRLAALLLALTMVVAIMVTSGANFLGINNYGGFNAELQLLYILASISIMLIGPGKYSIDKN